MLRPRDNKQVTMLEEVPTVDAHTSHPVGPSNGTITSIDLFAGAGGLSLGFHLADLGYMPVFAVEHESAAAATFARNFGCEVFDGDIECGPDYPEADLIVGGPPCQGFSPLGRDRDDLSRARLNGLWKYFLDAVRTIRPKAFVIENVREFQRSAQFAELIRLLETDSELNVYTPAFGVLNAADYGVPQIRHRGILVAVRDQDGDLPWPPAPLWGPDSVDARPYVTVREAIGDLPRRTSGTAPYFTEAGQHLHFGRRPLPESLERYKAIPPGGNRFDLMRNRPDITPACWANKPTGTDRCDGPSLVGPPLDHDPDRVLQAREGPVPAPDREPGDLAPRGRSAPVISGLVLVRGDQDRDRPSDRERGPSVARRGHCAVRL